MSTTTNIGMETPAHGAEVDTWNVPVNGNTTILDAITGSVTTKSLASTNVLLSTTESRVATLRFTGVLLGNVTITIGANAIKSWNVENLTTGLFTITLSGASGNVIGLPPGSCQAVWDGTNVSFINRQMIGEYLDYPSTAVPAWVGACTVPPYLHCNGGSFSAVTYPILNQILGGTTLPDSRGRARFTMNGFTGRLTTAGGIDGDTRFAAGGDGDGLVIGQANLPNVTFSVNINDPGHVHTVSGSNTVMKFVGAAGSGSIGAPSNVQQNASIDSAPTGITASAPSGGSGTALASVPPGYVGGITMIRAG